jgi:hypothetical protein
VWPRDEGGISGFWFGFPSPPLVCGPLQVVRFANRGLGSDLHVIFLEKYSEFGGILWNWKDLQRLWGVNSRFES